jgi:hypothetical protein
MCKVSDLGFLFRPVCGLCSKTHVMTTKGCQECPSEAVIAPLRNLAIAIGMIFITLFWFLYSWSPFFPTVGTCMNKLFICLLKTTGFASDKSSKVSNRVSEGLDLIQRLRLTQYLKIVIGYLQIMSSFLGLHVAWPSSILTAMMWCKATFNFSLLSLPGISCLWQNMDYDSKLMAYTLIPLCLAAMLYGPVLLITFLNPNKKYSKKEAQFSLIQDRFWQALMFILFLVNTMPVLSLKMPSALRTAVDSSSDDAEMVHRSIHS